MKRSNTYYCSGRSFCLFSFPSIDLVALLAVDPHDHPYNSTSSTSAPCCLPSLLLPLALKTKIL